MDFRLTEDQRALRAGVRELLEGRFGREALRAAVDAGDAGREVVPRGLWRELGGAGLFALCLPESAGGVGLGLPEAVLVFEEAGRALVPGPLVATFLAAGEVPGAAEGETVVTAADFAAGGSGEGLVLAYGREADALLGPPGAGTATALGGAGVLAVRSADPLTPLGRLPGGGGGVVGGAGEGGGVGGGLAAGAPHYSASQRSTGALLTAALQVGAALRCGELAVRYAKDREQFGRPIGGFQAVKHLCADMLARAEPARVAVYAAAVTGDPGEIAAAKLLADEAAVRGARDCLQVHGGMGFTWEADVHLYVKRAWVRAGQWLSEGEAEELLAADLAAVVG
ncbi:acyl-CoA dehydrogenase family protein [Streptomyces sp. BI20]|uniref:acyl-CoA dehydrogenase family protein n=1 Tax=Streptomyces sp. BI20 TaxID=3403460 RepID=UPI003C756E6B